MRDERAEGPVATGVYVSMTGLTLRSRLYAPLFWWHALRSMAQARGTAGLLRAEARTIDGVQHTLTVWQDEASMRAYLRSGAHRKAMLAFHRIALGRTLGFRAEVAPEWPEVHRRWLDEGRLV